MPDANIRVVCRFRPVNDLERSKTLTSSNNQDLNGIADLEFPDKQSILVKSARPKPLTFSFDRVFHDESTTQQEVYEYTAKDTIEDVLAGYNGTIFAYGQTSAGKSFTMFGPSVTHTSLKGIIPRACEHLFNRIASDASGTEFTLKCSYLEIYKENIFDLLCVEPSARLRVRETPARGVWVEGLSEHYVTNVSEVIELLETGEKVRVVSETNMNRVSSRSHSLFVLTLTQRLIDGSTKVGRLNLADLAGSEKVGKTGASGETLEEAKKINQSLSALGHCISTLSRPKRGHIPYRDSKLTHILRESLGGNAKTTLLIACSPHVYNYEETVSTLKFGQSAKYIKNVVHINRQRSVAELDALVKTLTQELALVKAYAEELEHWVIEKGGKEELEQMRRSMTLNGYHPSYREVPLDLEQEKVDQPLPSDEPLDENASTPLRRKISALLIPISQDQPSTPQVHFDSSYDPLALAEAQLQIQKMKEHYECRILDLCEEIEQLSTSLALACRHPHLQSQTTVEENHTQDQKQDIVEHSSVQLDPLLKLVQSQKEQLDQFQSQVQILEHERSSQMAQIHRWKLRAEALTNTKGQSPSRVELSIHTSEDLGTSQFKLPAMDNSLSKVNQDNSLALKLALEQHQRDLDHIFDLKKQLSTERHKSATLQNKLDVSAEVFEHMAKSMMEDNQDSVSSKLPLSSQFLTSSSSSSLPSKSSSTKSSNPNGDPIALLSSRSSRSNITRPMVGSGQSHHHQLKFTPTSLSSIRPTSPKLDLNTPDRRSFLDWLLDRQLLPSRDTLKSVARHRGFLWKQSGIFHQWKEQEFYLHEQLLYYFTKDSTVANGVYSLEGATISLRGHGINLTPEFRFQISIIWDHRKSVILCAHDMVEMHIWTEFLEEASCQSSANVERSSGNSHSTSMECASPYHNPN